MPQIVTTRRGLDRIVAIVLADNARSFGVIHRLAMMEGPARIHAGRPHRYFALERPVESGTRAADPAYICAAGE